MSPAGASGTILFLVCALVCAAFIDADLLRWMNWSRRHLVAFEILVAVSLTEAGWRLLTHRAEVPQARAVSASARVRSGFLAVLAGAFVAATVGVLAISGFAFFTLPIVEIFFHANFRTNWWTLPIGAPLFGPSRELAAEQSIAAYLAVLGGALFGWQTVVLGHRAAVNLFVRPLVNHWRSVMFISRA